MAAFTCAKARNSDAMGLFERLKSDSSGIAKVSTGCFQQDEQIF